jgi:hypothetical protein
MGLFRLGGRRGHDEDFVAYYEARAAALRRTAFILCGDWHLAEDLTQITFTKLYLAWRRLDHHGTLDGYAFLDERRRPWRRETSTVPDSPVFDVPVEHPAPGGTCCCRRWASPSASPRCWPSSASPPRAAPICSAPWTGWGLAADAGGRRHRRPVPRRPRRPPVTDRGPRRHLGVGGPAKMCPARPSNIDEVSKVVQLRICGPPGTRTLNLRIKSPQLCRLSRQSVTVREGPATGRVRPCRSG